MKQFINKDLCTLSSSKSSIHLLSNFSISTIQVESGNQNLLLSITLLWPSKWFWCFYFNFPWTYSSFCRQHSSKIWLRYRDFLQIVLIAQKIKPILYKTNIIFLLLLTLGSSSIILHICYYLYIFCWNRSMQFPPKVLCNYFFFSL